MKSLILNACKIPNVFIKRMYIYTVCVYINIIATAHQYYWDLMGYNFSINANCLWSNKLWFSAWSHFKKKIVNFNCWSSSSAKITFDISTITSTGWSFLGWTKPTTILLACGFYGNKMFSKTNSLKIISGAKWANIFKKWLCEVFAISNHGLISLKFSNFHDAKIKK